MKHRGCRNERAILRRNQTFVAKGFINRESFKDEIRAEKVSRTDVDQVTAFLGDEFGFCDVSAVPFTMPGIVISDGKGNGLHQNDWCWRCGEKISPPIPENKLCRACSKQSRIRRFVALVQDFALGDKIVQFLRLDFEHWH